MNKAFLTYLKHILLTFLVLIGVAIIFGLSIGASANYYEHPARLQMNNEGPFVFFKNETTIEVNYIHGTKTDGFYVDQSIHSVSDTIQAHCFFQLDSTRFEFPIIADFTTHPSRYEDNEPILAISDIEGNYKAFRDFLITHQVIDSDLNWTFGKGHLVLLGDFMDRGWSVTQVLWFIYKLEQEAKTQGGNVHFILGNHELKNLQDMFMDAPYRNYAAAAIIGKQHHNLYDSTSFMGRWLTSKNSIERINGNLFVHGGLHPDLADYDVDLDSLNAISRRNYRTIYYPKPEDSLEQLVLSNRTGISWYRGYFKEDVYQNQIDELLQNFVAQTIIVGHTLQSKVNTSFDGKVIGIDVKHPQDYRKTWPVPKSEGLLIEDQTYYRLLQNGERKSL